MRDKILKLVQENGPVLPVEVASKVGANSLLVNAFLEELVESKEIFSSKEKVGSVHLFFAKGQESKVEPRMRELNPGGKTAASYSNRPVSVTPELEAKRRDFSDRLERIAREEAQLKARKQTELARPQPKPTAKPKPQMKVIPKKPVVEVAKSFFKQKFSPRPVKPVTPPKSKESENLLDTALDYLQEKSIIILGEAKEISSKEHEIMVSVPSGVGPVRFLVKVKSKKKVNKSDLMQYYAEALERRVPVILFSDGELASTAKNYLKDAGGFLRIKLF